MGTPQLAPSKRISRRPSGNPDHLEYDIEVKSWVMASEVDGRWHPWISAGLAGVSVSGAGQCLQLGLSFI